jgi:hypothetical protein
VTLDATNNHATIRGTTPDAESVNDPNGELPNEQQLSQFDDPGHATTESNDEGVDLDDTTVLKVVEKFVPVAGQIKREELLHIAARELGFPRLTRDVRHRLNVAISQHVKSGVLRVDHNWDNVWRPPQMTFPR